MAGQRFGTRDEHLEDLMAVSYRNEFVDGWYEQGIAVGGTRGEARGREEGKAEGEAAGEARGEARTRANVIIRVPEFRGVRVTRAQQYARIASDTALVPAALTWNFRTTRKENPQYACFVSA
jgi:predicted transposase YdaD